jgi:hypothetical protein
MTANPVETGVAASSVQRALQNPVQLMHGGQTTKFRINTETMSVSVC